MEEEKKKTWRRGRKPGVKSLRDEGKRKVVRTVSLDRDTWERLDREADEAGLARAAYIRHILEFYWSEEK